jgi:hypothetical protein
MKHFISKLIAPFIDEIISSLRTTSSSSDINQSSIIKFSWYRMNCSDDENLLDILQEYSFLTYERPYNTALNPNYNLVMRECGGGMGVVVPGLWEVDVA